MIEQFCREWLNWIDAGCPEHEFFKPHYGLCSSYDYWILKRGTAEELNKRLTEHPLGFGNVVYPFNKDIQDYVNEMDKTKNPLRLRWARNRAGY